MISDSAFINKRARFAGMMQFHEHNTLSYTESQFCHFHSFRDQCVKTSTHNKHCRVCFKCDVACRAKDAECGLWRQETQSVCFLVSTTPCSNGLSARVITPSPCICAETEATWQDVCGLLWFGLVFPSISPLLIELLADKQINSIFNTLPPLCTL